MAGFGAQVDYFGYDSASLTFVESNTVPMATSVETAQDQDGNMAGLGDYEAGPADSIEVTYRLISGTLDLATLALGPKTVGEVATLITQIAVTTSNSEWPTIVVSGFTAVLNSDNMPTFTLPSITISGKKQAQGIDFTVGADCRLTGSSFTASGDVAHALDNDGVVGAMGFSGATAEISGDAVEIAGVVTWTPGGTWTETQAPGASGSNVSWGTASFAATKIIEPDE